MYIGAWFDFSLKNFFFSNKKTGKCFDSLNSKLNFSDTLLKFYNLFLGYFISKCDVEIENALRSFYLAVDFSSCLKLRPNQLRLYDNFSKINCFFLYLFSILFIFLVNLLSYMVLYEK